MRQKMSFGELPKEKGYLNEGEVLQIPLANRSACSNEQEGSNSKGIRAHQRLEVKTCPVCGARCFSDWTLAIAASILLCTMRRSQRGAPLCRNGRFTTSAYDTERRPALDSKPPRGEESASELRNCENGSKSLSSEISGIEPTECEEGLGGNAKASLVGLEKGVEVIVNISFAKSSYSKNGETVPTVMIETR